MYMLNSKLCDYYNNAISVCKLPHLLYLGCRLVTKNTSAVATPQAQPSTVHSCKGKSFPAVCFMPTSKPIGCPVLNTLLLPKACGMTQDLLPAHKILVCTTMLATREFGQLHVMARLQACLTKTYVYLEAQQVIAQPAS